MYLRSKRKHSCFAYSFRVIEYRRIIQFPAPKCLEIHSESRDWISKSSTEKLQPFRDILLFHIMGQRQHKHLLQCPLFVPFQSLQNMSSCPTAVSRIKPCNRVEATLLHSHYHLDWSFCLVQGQTLKKPSQRRTGERACVTTSICSIESFTQILLFMSPDLLSVRSSPERRPYCSRKQIMATDKNRVKKKMFAACFSQF